MEISGKEIEIDWKERWILEWGKCRLVLEGEMEIRVGRRCWYERGC